MLSNASEKDNAAGNYDQTAMTPYVIVMEGSCPEYKRTIYVNPQKNVRREISRFNGYIPDYPGVENMELLRTDCGNGICVHIMHDVEFQLLPDNRVRMLWEVQTGGGRIPSANGWLGRRGRQVRLYSELDEEGRFLFPFRIYNIGDRLYFGTNLEEEEKQAFLRKKQNPERYGIDGLTVSDLAGDWMKETLNRFMIQTDHWPTEEETAVYGFPYWVKLQIREASYLGEAQWRLDLIADKGPDAARELHIILETGPQKNLLDYMRQETQADVPKLRSFINHLCDKLSEEDDDPEDDDWW